MLRAAAVVLAFLVAAPVSAQQFIREELRIPMAAAGPRGLEAILVSPNDTKRHPLALISHGAPRDAEDRATMTPNRYDAQAVEFARRGYATLIVMRRGYGQSDGPYAESNGGCARPNYLGAAKASVEDLRAAIKAMETRKDVSTQGMIAVGQSAGGFATVALTADPPSGLVAAISFAGGRGSVSPGKVCVEDRLVEAFGTFGRTSRIPMLWVYTANDQYFAPALARQFHRTFTAAGGKAQLIEAPAFGSDGHSLFASGIGQWTPYVDAFFRAQNLGVRDPASVSLPDLPPPEQLSAKNRENFSSYLKANPHKAFAVSPSGAFGWRTGRRTAEEAREAALAACSEHGNGCMIYAVDDALAGTKR